MIEENDMLYYEDEEDDEVDNGIQPDEMQPNGREQGGGENGGNGIGNRIKNSVGDKAKEKGKEKLKKEMMKKAGKKAAMHGKFAAALGPILFWAIIIILIIIVIIGIIMFIVTMPGMVMEKIKQLGKMIAKGMASWFGADTSSMVEEETVYNTLEYLEQMGYDINGMGFITEYMTSSDLSGLPEGAEVDEEAGVIKDENGQILKASSDFVMAYQISDNYTYTLKNKNLVTSEGFKGKLQALGRHFVDFFGGSYGDYWTRGLIGLYEETDTIGYLDTSKLYSDTGLFNWDNLSIDVEAQTLTIEDSGWFNSNNPMTYSLDGWTGRYGMPIDFLISVHLATMMPDLAYDMANSFETEIRMILHRVTGADVQASYLSSGQYVTYDQFEQFASEGVMGGIHGWRIGPAEAMKIMKEYGIQSPEDCYGPDNEDLNEKLKDEVVKQEALVGDSIWNSDELYGHGLEQKTWSVNSYNGIKKFMKDEYGYENEDFRIITSLEEYASYNEDELLNYSTQIEDAWNELKDFATESVAYADQADFSADIEMKFGLDPYFAIESFSFVKSGQFSYRWLGNNTTYGERYYNADVCVIYAYDTENDPDNPGEIITREEQMIVYYIIRAEKTEEEIAQLLEDFNITNPDEITKCSETEEATECCEICRKFLQQIYDELKDPDDGDYDFYMPYIHSVVEHWYRDVMFSSQNVASFVENDYDYESLMHERWTLYETYPAGSERAGEYILYEIYAEDEGTHKAGEYKIGTDNGLKIFDGTQEEADEQNIAVAKKAKTFNNSDSSKLEDLGWNKDGSIWSAYDDGADFDSGWERTYEESEYADDSEDMQAIKQQIYHRIKTNKAIKQTGEGQRIETNPKIKQMFLNNTYFRYNGSIETSKIITALRNDNNIDYGPLSESDLTKTATVDGETYKVADYSGEVTLNQDSLNAFSMLENTHTLDADYIYRDFKELIVELGYFTKEELTDETPRLMQWIVPEIGSIGFPDRIIDKREDVPGTMIHSKGDIEANDKYTLSTLLGEKDALYEENEGDIPEEETEEPEETALGATGFTITGSNNAIEPMVASSASGSSESKTINTSVSLADFLEKAEEVHARMEGNVWEYCWGSSSHRTGNNNRHWREYHSHRRYATWEAANSGNKTADCSTYTCWVLQECGILPEGVVMRSGDFIDGDWFKGYVLTVEEAGELQPGDILAKHGHVQINGEDGIQYNAGGDAAIQKKPHAYTPDFHTHVIRLPFGREEGELYEGYEGNEAVVSPVTGILLEYGTYDNTGITPAELEDKAQRINVDLKYGPLNYEQQQAAASGASGSQPASSGYLSKIIADEVGYARILVLDSKNYQILEQSTNNIWKNKSLVSEDGEFDEYLTKGDGKTAVEKLDDLGEESISATVYGYKEFAELYTDYGIAGYEIIIDGFIPELQDSRYVNTTGVSKELPDGEDIDMSYFQKITESNFDSDEQLETKYIPDEVYKFASESYTDKYKAELTVKQKAATSMYIPSTSNSITNEDLIFIKEGTVLGRTMTDKELLEVVRNGETGTYEENRVKVTTTTATGTETQNVDNVIGNYLRIVMTSTHQEIIENVEDYMKLDAGEEVAQPQEYKAWEGDLEILAEVMYHESSYGYLKSKSNLFRTDQKEADFEMYCMGYSVVNKLLEQNKQWYDHLYDESRTDRSPLAQVVTSEWYGCRDEMEAFISGAKPASYTEKELEYAEYCLTYDCTSIKKPYKSNLGSVALDDGYSTTEQGTTIPRAMCQQGGYGDGAPGQSNIILVGFWDHNNNNEFDVGDELWGVDRFMEHLIE